MYMAGASLVGAPSMTHGRTPYVAWGCTAINPDVTDLYIEQIADDKYLSSNQEWKPII
jgi:penicillin G amidase